MGWKLSPKTELIPATETKFLGFSVNSTLLKLFPTAEKLEKILNLIFKVLKDKNYTISQIQKITGKFCSLTPDKESIWTRSLNNLIAKATVEISDPSSHTQYVAMQKKSRILPEEVSNDLHFIINRLFSIGFSGFNENFTEFKPDYFIVCDTSDTCIGGYVLKLVDNSYFLMSEFALSIPLTDAEIPFHSSHRELLGFFKFISFLYSANVTFFMDKYVQLVSDNLGMIIQILKGKADIEISNTLIQRINLMLDSFMVKDWTASWERRNNRRIIIADQLGRGSLTSKHFSMQFQKRYKFYQLMDNASVLKLIDSLPNNVYITNEQFRQFSGHRFIWNLVFHKLTYRQRRKIIAYIGMLPGDHVILKVKRTDDMFLDKKVRSFSVDLDISPKDIFSKKFIFDFKLFTKKLTIIHQKAIS